MIVKVSYSQLNFDETVKFISKNNTHFKGNDSYIKKCMIDGIESLVSQFPDCNYYSTMGFTILVSNLNIRSPKEKENSIEIEFLVDPDLGFSGQFNWKSEDYIQR